MDMGNMRVEVDKSLKVALLAYQLRIAMIDLKEYREEHPEAFGCWWDYLTEKLFVSVLIELKYCCKKEQEVNQERENAFARMALKEMTEVDDENVPVEEEKIVEKE